MCYPEHAILAAWLSPSPITLRRARRSDLAAQHDHPFVRGIGDGTLDVERFAFWIRQDYLFLIEYCRLFALGAARAPDLDTIARFADLLQVTARTEMDLHRGYAAQFGISAGRSSSTRRWRRPRAATPTSCCAWPPPATSPNSPPRSCPACGASRRSGAAWPTRPRPADARYAAWVEMYADPEFAALAEWCRALVDRLADDAGPQARQRMEAAFVTSSRYELAFWDAAYRLEHWPDRQPSVGPPA